MIKFAAFTDLHYDHVFDGNKRIDDFLSVVKNENLDFIISLGDLCYPIVQNNSVIEKLNTANVPIYYVIGNHDSDIYSQDTVRSFLQLDKLNYSFIIEKTKFIVLNSCFMKQDGIEYPYFKKNYEKKSDIYPIIPRYEIEWLRKEMQDENLCYVIFSHHSLANDFAKRGIANREEIREIISTRKTVLCMNGHDHGEDCKILNGIPYVTLNSMTYIWHGMKEIFAFSTDIHNKYPNLKDMILYKDALYCIVEIDENAVNIKGVESEYMHIAPEDVGIAGRKWNGVSIVPKVSDFRRAKYRLSEDV